jgi:hypothetical protein
MTVIAGVEAVVILVLLCALIYGQPASFAADHAQLVSYRATVQAIPTSTPRPCRLPQSYYSRC